MNQAALDREVARLTGETVTQIRKLGFSLMVPEPPRNEPLPNIARARHIRNHPPVTLTKRSA